MKFKIWLELFEKTPGGQPVAPQEKFDPAATMPIKNMPSFQNIIQQFPQMADLEISNPKMVMDRLVIVTNHPQFGRRPFYRSSGSNSQMANTWLPFRGFAAEEGQAIVFMKAKGAKNSDINSRWGSGSEAGITQAISQTLGAIPFKPTQQSSLNGIQLNLWLATPESKKFNDMYRSLIRYTGAKSWEDFVSRMTAA